MHNVNTHNELKLIVSVLAVLFFLQDRCRSFAFHIILWSGRSIAVVTATFAIIIL